MGQVHKPHPNPPIPTPFAPQVPERVQHRPHSLFLSPQACKREKIGGNTNQQARTQDGPKHEG